MNEAVTSFHRQIFSFSFLILSLFMKPGKTSNRLIRFFVPSMFRGESFLGKNGTELIILDNTAYFGYTTVNFCSLTLERIWCRSNIKTFWSPEAPASSAVIWWNPCFNEEAP